ncbi:MAG: DUF6174 domain-containing protein [Gemmatimonadota bacterium]|nr:DUF6174 domain-containing protein [Gemmatimonadota bacterium]
MRLLAAALFATISASTTSCDVGGIFGPGNSRERRELLQHERAWDARGITDYSYRLERDCFCSADIRTPMRVVVRHGLVVSAVYLPSGDAVPSAILQHVPSVDGLFDIIRDAIGRDAHELRVTYDRERDYPALIEVDYDVGVADDESSYRASELLVW